VSPHHQADPTLDTETFTLLERLAELRASGALTEEQFRTTKERIMQARAAAAASASPPRPAASTSSTSPGSPVTTAAITDFITTQLGLDRIEQFSLGHLFSETFKKHPPEEIENLFSVGTSLTTPPLSDEMKKFPTPWVFFRALMASLLVFFVFLVMYFGTSNSNLVPGVIIVGSFSVPLATLIFFFEMNTPRNVSMYRVLSFVFAGGTVSLLLTFVLSSMTGLSTVLGSGAAGIIEESAKLAAVVFFLTLLPANQYPYRLNALLFGAAVGTGFSAFESAGYALRYGLQGGANVMVNVIVVRALLTPLAHIAWTAITSAAYWSARRHHATIKEAITSPTFLKLFAAPVVLHFLWNTIGNFWINAALGFVAWVIIISLVQSGLKDLTTGLPPAPATPSGQPA
jgi:RsiW-degrading membrane proteinase PrsW (M82 family)